MKIWLIVISLVFTACGMDPGKGLASRGSHVSSYGEQDNASQNKDSGDSVIRNRGTIIGNGNDPVIPTPGDNAEPSRSESFKDGNISPGANQYAEILESFDFHGFNSQGLLTSDGLINVVWEAKTDFECVLAKTLLTDTTKSYVMAETDSENKSTVFQGKPTEKEYSLSLVCSSPTRTAIIFDLALHY